MTSEQLKKKLQKAIDNEDEEFLIDYLDIKNFGKINEEHYDLIKKTLLGTWHTQHEDIVNTIYLENLTDERFIEPILEIAIKKDIYRSLDSDLESTLRKCVHVLKMINSQESNEAIEKLKSLNNDNVKNVLETYKN